MAMDMSDVLKIAVKAGAVEQITKKLGISDNEASSALEVVLPLLITGMQSQAKNKDTKSGFLKALDDHSKDDTGDLAKFMKNVDTDDGAKIVKHLLGSKQEEVAAKATKKSGLDTKTILKIMAIMAPILMSKMGKTAKTEAKSAGKDEGSIVGDLLGNIDAGDVVKIIGLLMK